MSFGGAVASSREDAWIETSPKLLKRSNTVSRPPARTRGLKQNDYNVYNYQHVASSREDAWIETRTTNYAVNAAESRPPARTRGLKPQGSKTTRNRLVASSREDAWIETCYVCIRFL